MAKSHKWETYEQVAVYLLNQIAKTLDLEKVEAKQKIIGNRSGTTWEIDGKGVKNNKEGFIIIECRCYRNSKQKQEQVAAFAYRIEDTGARGGIIVSPLGIQEGAKKIAASANIQTITLNEDSTTKDYILRFLNRVFVGMSDVATATAELKVEVIRNPKSE